MLCSANQGFWNLRAHRDLLEDRVKWKPDSAGKPQAWKARTSNQMTHRSHRELQACEHCFVQSLTPKTLKAVREPDQDLTIQVENGVWQKWLNGLMIENKTNVCVPLWVRLGVMLTRGSTATCCGRWARVASALAVIVTRVGATVHRATCLTRRFRCLLSFLPPSWPSELFARDLQCILPVGRSVNTDFKLRYAGFLCYLQALRRTVSFIHTSRGSNLLNTGDEQPQHNWEPVGEGGSWQTEIYYSVGTALCKLQGLCIYVSISVVLNLPSAVTFNSVPHVVASSPPPTMEFFHCYFISVICYIYDL